jgi:hypothetical protein
MPTAGPAVTLTSAETATPGFIPAIAGDYVFSLVVNDGQDNSPADTVTATVKPAALFHWKPKLTNVSARARIQICLAPVTKKAKPVCDTGDGDFVIRK